MFIIYTLSDCPYSMNALEVLQQGGLKYKNITVTDKNKKKICKKNKMKTFPQIFFKKAKKNYKIGGCNDLLELVKLIKYLNTLPFHIDLICSLSKTFKRKKIV